MNSEEYEAYLNSEQYTKDRAYLKQKIRETNTKESLIADLIKNGSPFSKEVMSNWSFDELVNYTKLLLSEGD